MQDAVRDPRLVQDALERVMADPVLQEGLRESHHQTISWREYLLLLVLRGYSRLVLWLEELSSDSPFLYYTFLAVLVIVLVLLLAHMATTFAGALRQRGTLILPPTAAEARRRSFEEHRSQARELARNGRCREAVRELVLALLALLEERRHPVARNWTNREILARLHLAGEAEVPLRRFQQRAEGLSYGGDEPDAVDFAGLDEILEKSVRAIPVRRPGEPP